MNKLRECINCGLRAYTVYDLQFFQKREVSLYGVNNMCKLCANKKGRNEGAASKEKYQIAKRYNCSREDYLESMKTSSVCQICGNINNLCYDHCHDTDKFRGVLCRSCNAAIGQLGDNSKMLFKAFNYLKEFESSLNI